MPAEPTRSPRGFPELRAFALRRALLATAALIAVFGGVVAGMGWSAYSSEWARNRDATLAHVGSVADLKAAQVVSWREERRRDVEYLTLDPHFVAGILAVHRGTATDAVVAELRRRLAILYRSEEYRQATLLQPDGRTPISDGFAAPAPDCRELATRALTSAAPIFGEIQQEGPDGAMHLDVAAPVRHAAGRSVIGVLLVQINPQRVLFPSLQAWPGIFESAETLLVRQEGNSVLYLNEVRHAPGRQGSFLERADTAKLPASLAAAGRRLNLEGIDYDGRPVLAATRPVPGTSWGVVAKVDSAEALAGTRAHGWLLFTSLAGLVGLAAMGGGLGVFVVQSRFYRRQYREAADRQAMLERHAEAQSLAEAQLRESGERLRLALAGSATTLYIQDADLRYTWVYNPVHHAPDEVIGRTDEELFGASGRLLSEMKQRVVEAGVPARQEISLSVKGKARAFDITIEPLIADGLVAGVRGVAVDVTDRRQLEEQLRQAQKLEAVGRLAGGIAHDFNNLLTAINGYAELVVSELGPDSPHRADLLEVQKAGTRAAALTRQLLAFSRKQVLQPVPVDVDPLITQTSAMLRRIIGEDVSLNLELGANGSVFADPGQLEQVLLNLTVNSRDAMPEGGTIVIRTARVAAPTGARIRIVVSDTGSGIAPEVLPQIFEPFFTTKERGKGTGLGLSTVYGVVQQSGGTLDVKSAPGQGTTFTIEFPESFAVGAPAPEPSPAGTGHERVLVVEDDTPVRLLAEQILVRAGYRVVSVADGAAALELAHRERFDLLILDMVMADMDGRAVAAALAPLSPTSRVLYMSGYAADVLATRGVQDGMRLLQKPFTVWELTNAVRNALDAEPGGA